MNLERILAHFDKSSDLVSYETFGNGLINATYKITTSVKAYVLQKINKRVFPNPLLICQNIEALQRAVLQSDEFKDLLVPLLPSLSKHNYYIDHNDDYWRLMPYVEGLTTYDVVESPWQATEAARAFGRFLRLGSYLDISGFHQVIPNFHSSEFRVNQFEEAEKRGNVDRKKRIKGTINRVRQYFGIFKEMQSLDLPVRITHNDTKLNNVLFDEVVQKHRHVIDLDTVMPGSLLYDFGDMIRTYTCSVSENEPDITKISLNIEYFQALCVGFFQELGSVMTASEKKNLVLAGKFMTLLMAIRFLTDYLNNDQYYLTTYPEQNYVRSKNQLAFLDCIINHEMEMQRIVETSL